MAKLCHDNSRWMAEGTQLCCAEAREGYRHHCTLSGSCCDASPRGTLRRLALLFQFRPAVEGTKPVSTTGNEIGGR